MNGFIITPLLGLLVASSAFGSSHREAPSIARDAEADITDVYVFKSPERSAEGYITFVMNVSPAAQGYAGPNWYQFGDDVLYELHIDTTGDAVEDVTYQFRFKTDDYRNKEGLVVANFPEIKFQNGGFTGSLSQTYSVTKIEGNRRTGKKTEIAKNLPVAPPRIGPYTTDGGAVIADDNDPATPSPDEQYYANYRSLADNAISLIGGSKWFAGPRNDPFFVDLGGVFDRVGVRIPNVTGTPRDSLATSNIQSIVFEINTSTFLAADQKHFGVWATTSRPQAKVLRTGGKEAKYGGGWVQVSRLGNPLVNEVVIKMQDKDKFNATEPKDDAANYAQYVTEPQLAFVLNALYGSAGSTVPGFISDIALTNRTDMVAAFVTGLPDINKHPKATATGGDMIRVNVDFGIQEWPLSGRNLADNVVKSALVFLAQCKTLSGLNSAPATESGVGVFEPTTANCALDDFVTEDSATPGNTRPTADLAAFPYLDLPHSAYGSSQ